MFLVMGLILKSARLFVNSPYLPWGLKNSPCVNTRLNYAPCKNAFKRIAQLESS